MADLVATLIARPENAAELEAAAAKASRMLGAAPDWLGAGEAVDLRPRPGSTEARAVLDEIAAGRPVDAVLQPASGRRKRLLLADMDSTMIGQECIDELADMAGLKAHVAAITERAMRGEIAFEPALRERVGLLAGLPLAVIDQVIAERIKLSPGATTLIATMRRAGAYTALVSGGFTHFTERVAKAIGFDENRANVLLIEDGKFSGRVVEPILGQDAKLAALKQLRGRLGLAAPDTIAVGDGANDLPMIKEAGLGVAFHAKPKVAAEAAARIDHADLTALLFLQGYRRTEFVTVPEPVV